MACVTMLGGRLGLADVWSGRARWHVTRAGDVCMTRSASVGETEAVNLVQRYRRYHLSWRQLRTTARVGSRRRMEAVIRAALQPVHKWH